MPIVTIDMWAGRTKEQKEMLIEKVTRAVVDSVGCPPEAVHMIIREVEKSNWGMGGKSADKLFPK